jgi:hypothetical protein
MTLPFQMGWSFAYLIWDSVVDFIPSDKRNEVLKNATDFYKTIANLTFDEQVSKILT